MSTSTTSTPSTCSRARWLSSSGPSWTASSAPAGSLSWSPRGRPRLRQRRPRRLRFLNFHAPGCGFADYLRGRGDFDQHPPPADGGRPASDALVGRPASGERFQRDDRGDHDPRRRSPRSPCSELDARSRLAGHRDAQPTTPGRQLLRARRRGRARRGRRRRAGRARFVRTPPRRERCTAIRNDPWQPNRLPQRARPRRPASQRNPPSVAAERGRLYHYLNVQCSGWARIAARAKTIRPIAWTW